MKIKTIFLLSVLLLFAGCLRFSQNSIEISGKKLSEAKTLTVGLYTASSGKEIRIINISKIDFPESGPALVMTYKTEIPIENMPELRKEVDEIWEVFRKDAEAAAVKAAAIRAVVHENKEGKGSGYGFVFEQRDDGSWFHIGDEEKNEKR